jgi:hypothetical protein
MFLLLDVDEAEILPPQVTTTVPLTSFDVGRVFIFIERYRRYLDAFVSLISGLLSFDHDLGEILVPGWSPCLCVVLSHDVCSIRHLATLNELLSIEDV